MYTTKNLPPLIPQTCGIARPKSGPDVAVCVAPAAATISRPPSWGAGQDLEIDKGVKHIAQDGEGDSYPNMEYDTFYETNEKLNPVEDSRAKFLVEFWAKRGFANVEVRLGRKVRPANVVGEVGELPEGRVMFQNHEGVSELSSGGYILQSPDDPSVMWFITRKVYDKKYSPVEKN